VAQKVFIVNIGTVWKYVVPIQNCGLLWIFTNLVWQEMRLKIWIIRKESFSLMVLKGIKTIRLSSAISKGTGMSKILVGQAYLIICQVPPAHWKLKSQKMVGTSLFQRPWLVCRSATFETGKNMQYFHPASAKEVHGRKCFKNAFCYSQFNERG
jgi:hypothetical protein